MDTENNGQRHCCPRTPGSDDIPIQKYLAVESSRRFGGTVEERAGVVRIPGLPNFLDIILSYQPPSTLSSNVPAIPRAFPAPTPSDSAGDVQTVSDLSQAVPMQCIVPIDRPPLPGEHLMVTDPLFDPPAGEARYYLAAVNYQGQSRAGRSAINGVLQGRNAAALPSCD